MLKSSSILFLCLVDFLHLINCGTFYLNTCPDIKTIETFDLDRYMGTWYQYAKYVDTSEKGQKCQMEVWKNEGNGTVSRVYNYVLKNKANSIRDVGKVIKPGQLSVLNNSNPEIPNYFVLGTDYDNWAVAYNCVQHGVHSHIRHLWIMTRERQASLDTIVAVYSTIKRNKLTEEFLYKLEQPQNCAKFYKNTGDKQCTGSCSIL